MSDLHHLPLLGHDLPANVIPLRSIRPPTAFGKIQVFKEAERWTWEHFCPRMGIFVGGMHHAVWELALKEAGDHVRECR